MGGGRFRRWVACILPCGALDIIRVVHNNGNVEEYDNPISAGDILLANPGHILSLPYSNGGLSPRIVILSHSSILKRGRIYFLVPRVMEDHDHRTLENYSAAGDARTTRVGHRRSRSVPVMLWKPQLEQISENPLRHPVPEEDEN
ncbi:unknownprotein [Zostera marina]|uniref:Uncharacterized protein n=1 Tax=Zostera marina TaxID=29655 RepID=A0A0K9PFQ6_ZOSMR|nr:unknownprotein [Zostera marina]